MNSAPRRITESGVELPLALPTIAAPAQEFTLVRQQRDREQRRQMTGSLQAFNPVQSLP
jgi:hypothetical protein